MRVKVKKSVAEFIEDTGNCMTTHGNRYFYIPFWFKKTDEEGIYEEYFLDDLPQELIDAIKFFRENKPSGNSGEILSYPITKTELNQP
jgi:hypothetical protein